MKKVLELGVISSATRRPERVIPALLDALGSVAPEARAALMEEHELPTEALTDDEHGYWQDASPEMIGYLLHHTIDRVSDHAPPYCYCGAHMGNSPDIGIWPDWHVIHDAVHDGCIYRIDSGAGWEDVPQSVGMVVDVSDPGNAELYRREPSGDWSPLWSVV